MNLEIRPLGYVRDDGGRLRIELRVDLTLGNVMYPTPRCNQEQMPQNEQHDRGSKD